MGDADVEGEVIERAAFGFILHVNTAVLRRDAVNPATDGSGVRFAEVGVDGVDVAPAAAGGDFIGHLVGDIDFITADELVAFALVDLDKATRTDRCLNEVGDADVVTVGVVATDRKVEAVLEEGAFEAVVVTIGDLGFEGGIVMLGGVVVLGNEVALAVTAVDAQVGREFVVKAKVGLGEVDRLVDHRAGDIRDRRGPRRSETDEVAIAETNRVETKTGEGEQATLHEGALLAKQTADDGDAALLMAGLYADGGVEWRGEVGNRTGGVEIRIKRHDAARSGGVPSDEVGMARVGVVERRVPAVVVVDIKGDQSLVLDLAAIGFVLGEKVGLQAAAVFDDAGRVGDGTAGGRNGGTMPVVALAGGLMLMVPQLLFWL